MPILYACARAIYNKKAFATFYKVLIFNTLQGFFFVKHWYSILYIFLRCNGAKSAASAFVFFLFFVKNFFFLLFFSAAKVQKNVFLRFFLVVNYCIPISYKKNEKKYFF